MSSVAGIAGTFLDGRWLTLFCLPLVLGVHRSKGLRGMHIASQLVAYSLVLMMSGILLWEMGIRWNAVREQTITDIGHYVVSHLPNSWKPTSSEASVPANPPPASKSPTNPASHGTPSKPLEPSIGQDATPKQVIAWGKPLMETIRDGQNSYDMQFAQLYERLQDARNERGAPQAVKEIDDRISELRIRTTRDYWNCCVEDAIRYREALLARLPGGWDNENMRSVFTTMRDRGTNVAHAGETLIAMILGDLELLTNGLDRPLRSLSDKQLRIQVDQFSQKLQDFAQEWSDTPTIQLPIMTPKLGSRYRQEFSEDVLKYRVEMSIRLGKIPTEPELANPNGPQQITDIRRNLQELCDLLSESRKMR